MKSFAPIAFVLNLKLQLRLQVRLVLLWTLGQWRLGSLGRRRLLRRAGLFDSRWYSSACRNSLLGELDPLLHYLTLGWLQGLMPAPGFSARRYQHLLKQRGLSPWTEDCSALLDVLKRLQSRQLELSAVQTLIDRDVPFIVGSSEQRLLPLTLVGPFGSPTGLGQAARNLAYTFDTAGVSVQFHDLPMAGPRVDTEFATKSSELPDGGTVMLVLPLSRVALEPLRGLRGRRRVLYPSWELEHLPSDCESLLKEEVDAFWAPSSFIAAGLKPLGKPVRLFSQPIRIPPSSLVLAAQDERVEAPFTVLTYCDLDSYPARKNPFAALDVFQRAFAGRADVCLKVKLRGRHGVPVRREMRRRVQCDSRVQLLDQTLSREAMDQLLLNCDAFLSLHRSEGVGFGPGEALAAARPVVTTHYGGVTDFIHAHTAFPVGYELVPVKRGQYPHARGQHWAEPNLAEAVKQLRWIEAHRTEAQEHAWAGRSWLQEHQSIDAMAQHLLSKELSIHED